MGTFSLEDSSDEEEDFESALKMSAQALADLLDLPYPPKPIKTETETKACFKTSSKSASLRAALLTRKK